MFCTLAAVCAGVGFWHDWKEPGAALDLHFHDTYIVIANLHLWLLPAGLLLLFAAAYWAMRGLSATRAQRLLTAVHFIGMTVPVIAALWPWPPQAAEMPAGPRRYYDYTTWQSALTQTDRLVAMIWIFWGSGLVTFVVKLLMVLASSLTPAQRISR